MGKSNFLSFEFLHRAIWIGWRRWVVWAVCIAATLSLGMFRAITNAEFTLASLLLFPVLIVAWLGGKKNGLLMAFFAAAMWFVGDITSGREFSTTWIPWANVATHFITYSLVAILAAQVCLQFKRERERATTDVLTGLQNRRAFLNAGDSEADRSKRYAHPLSVVFLDMDNFKQLNDAMGHDAGDAALRATAMALLRSLRASDQAARLGGDEFAILLPEVEYDKAVEAGRKIFVAVNRALRDFPPVTGSVGIAWFEAADRTFTAMLKAADELMYEVKENGKNNMRSRRFTALNKQGDEG